MIQNKSSPDQKTRNVYLVVVAAAAAALLVVYIATFKSFPPGQPDAWGQFGDYMGGLLNPLISALALVFFARSYSLQKKELSETRDLLRRQIQNSNRESLAARFFEFMRLYQKSLAGLEFSSDSRRSRGKDAIERGVVEWRKDGSKISSSLSAFVPHLRILAVLLDFHKSSFDASVPADAALRNAFRAQLSESELQLVAIECLRSPAWVERLADTQLLEFLEDRELRSKIDTVCPYALRAKTRPA